MKPPLYKVFVRVSQKFGDYSFRLAEILDKFRKIGHKTIKFTGIYNNVKRCFRQNFRDS